MPDNFETSTICAHGVNPSIFKTAKMRTITTVRILVAQSFQGFFQEIFNNPTQVQ